MAPFCQRCPPNQHSVLISPHRQQEIKCKSYGFKRINQYHQQKEKFAEAAFSKYNCIYFMGLGRWDSESTDCEGLSTYGLNTCCAFVISDSLSNPTRAVLIHASFGVDFSPHMAEEAKWVFSKSNKVEVHILKGFQYRDLDPKYFESFVQSELRWELTDRRCLRIRHELDKVGLSEVPLLLEHVPLHCGVVTIGKHGLLIPSVPRRPTYQMLGRELPLQEIAARHSAFLKMEKDKFSSLSVLPLEEYHKRNRTCRLDVQFDGKKYVHPVGDLQKYWTPFKSKPLESLPCQPLCCY
jgi:hypothetical protein